MIVAAHIIYDGSNDAGCIELIDLNKLSNINKYKHKNRKNVLVIPLGDWEFDGEKRSNNKYIQNIPGLFLNPPQLVQDIYTIFIV